MKTADPSRIINMTSAFYNSRVLFTASDLGVFGKLSELGSADSETLAQELNTDSRGIRLLLDACVAIELLSKDGDLYSNTDESAAFLVPGNPGDLSGAIRYNRDVYPAWGKLTNLVETGKPVESPELHLGDDKERTRVFVLAMHGRAMAIGRAVVPQLDLSGCKKLIDLGGGPATYAALIAQQNPELHCTVMDLPGVVEVAAELIEGKDYEDRIELVPGDYRTATFPGGFDVANFFGVLHQESPESIVALFKKAFDALEPGGKINVLDMMTDETHTQPTFSALFAVNMALTTENGWVFSDTELKGWLEEAGFVDFACSPLAPPMPHWLATARKPS
jgi:SAM-dependent methyltransferase